MENRLLWKHNKIQSCDEIPLWKRDNCGNAIKLVNVVNFHFGGTRQIFNSVEYSEAIVELTVRDYGKGAECVEGGLIAL